MDIKNSQTEKNLWEAIKGECFAANKYLYFASKAKKEGYEQFCEIFTQTADNEKEHAKIWFKILQGGDIKSTLENLQDCIKNEHYENSQMYPAFAKKAEEEGFEEIKKLFEEVALIEANHEKRFKKLLKNLTENKVFKKDEICNWECSNCGNIIIEKEAPKSCPVCGHAQAYFCIEKNNF